MGPSLHRGYDDGIYITVFAEITWATAYLSTLLSRVSVLSPKRAKATEHSACTVFALSSHSDVLRGHVGPGRPRGRPAGSSH